MKPVHYGLEYQTGQTDIDTVCGLVISTWATKEEERATHIRQEVTCSECCQEVIKELIDENKKWQKWTEDYRNRWVDGFPVPEIAKKIRKAELEREKCAEIAKPKNST